MAGLIGSVHGAGVGLRLPHLQEVVTTRPAAGWFEIHPETFLANPHAIELLLKVAERYPISVHTVGVSVGSAHGVDLAHLRRVKSLVDLVNPFAVSGHIAWSTHPGEYLNDLIPLPYDDETLNVLAAHIERVQDELGRPYLLENPSSYFGYRSSTMTEPQFLSALVERTGCALLCDVSNVHVSSHNLGFDARAYIDAMPAAAVRELHLGGFTTEDDDATPSGTVLVDTHGTHVSEAAWDLYTYATARFGGRPTLIEWDNDIPALATLLTEAARADEIAARASRTSPHATAR
jgi:uncharacterized protein (UPF0276 family)